MYFGWPKDENWSGNGQWSAAISSNVLVYVMMYVHVITSYSVMHRKSHIEQY